MEKQSLDELGVKYGTDKSSLLHNYLHQYEKYIKSPESFKHILEIGLQRGGKWRNEHTSPSLSMWGEFFPNATLYGFDIKNLNFLDPRVRFSKVDQGNLAELISVVSVMPSLDFVIDDGSHINTHQIQTFLAIWPLMKEGSIYIIEDMNPVVQRDVLEGYKIHNLIQPYIESHEYYWIDSDNAGLKSSLLIIK